MTGVKVKYEFNRNYRNELYGPKENINSIYAILKSFFYFI